MSIQSIEQKRAKYALDKINGFLKETNDDKKCSEWKTRANEMPAMIQMNGLGQTAAFYLSKGDVHGKMYALLSEWICDHMGIYAERDLIRGITQGDIHQYRLAQAESQALLLWVKKFSKAFVKGD